ncbi:MAG: hypothetical protein ACRCSP_06200 [Rhodoglobus sp.]
MAYKGTVLTVGAMLERAQAAPEPAPRADVGLRHEAATTALRCAALLTQGDGLDECWRFGIVQTLDDYNSTLRRGGAQLAAQVFAAEPAHTGSAEIDAGFAALAEHLAHRDGWNVPSWAVDPARSVKHWYPDVPRIFYADAERESPNAFRSRGIYITDKTLKRA